MYKNCYTLYFFHFIVAFYFFQLNFVLTNSHEFPKTKSDIMRIHLHISESFRNKIYYRHGIDCNNYSIGRKYIISFINRYFALYELICQSIKGVVGGILRKNKHSRKCLDIREFYYYRLVVQRLHRIQLIWRHASFLHCHLFPVTGKSRHDF